jgi:hypothetical protein
VRIRTAVGLLPTDSIKAGNFPLVSQLSFCQRSLFSIKEVNYIVGYSFAQIVHYSFFYFPVFIRAVVLPKN